MAGAFLVSDFGLLVMMLRAFSRDLPCCGDRTRGFGRLLVYRVVLLLSLKISNATLLKLVFRYNGRREFVEEQARSPL